MENPFILEIPLTSKANRAVCHGALAFPFQQYRLHSEQSGCQWKVCIKTQKASVPKILLDQVEAAWPVTQVLVTEIPFFTWHQHSFLGSITCMLSLINSTCHGNVLLNTLLPALLARYPWCIAGERRHSSLNSRGCQLPSITMPHGRNNLLLVFTREEMIPLGPLQYARYWHSPAFTGVGQLCKSPLPLVSPTCPAAQGEMGDSCIQPSMCSFPMTHVPTWSCLFCSSSSLTPSPLSPFHSILLWGFTLCPWKHLKSLIRGRCWNKHS